MGQLRHTGWMHDRERMIAASFLVKHVLTDRRQGDEWFWDMLRDAAPRAMPSAGNGSQVPAPIVQHGQARAGTVCLLESEGLRPSDQGSGLTHRTACRQHRTPVQKCSCPSE
ncbi:FAD-binding domain-containing protein [Microvirga makkahensis]